MPAFHRRLTVPVLATAAALAAGLSLAHTAMQEAPAPPAAPTSAESNGSVTEPAALSLTDEPVGWCGAEMSLRSPDLPKGATVSRLAGASFEDLALLAAVRDAVAEAAGVGAARVDCDRGGVETAASEPEKERDREVTDAAPHVGNGSCMLAHAFTPSPPVSGASLEVTYSGHFSRRRDEAAVRTVIADASGHAPEAVECEFHVPPIGHCHAELAPDPAHPVPAGATVGGSVYGEYTREDQLDALKEALAAMSRLPIDAITCETVDVRVAEPLPVEPDGGPGDGAEPLP